MDFRGRRRDGGCRELRAGGAEQQAESRAELQPGGPSSQKRVSPVYN